MGKNAPAIVYSARNVFTGKLYIGSTLQTLAQRRVKHESRALKDLVNRPLYRDIRRLGKDSFEWQEVIRCESEEQVRAYESELIELLDTARVGYNVAPDGGCNRGGTQTEASRLKMSAARKEWWKRNGNTKARGYTYTHRSPHNMARILALRDAGKSYREIGKEFGLQPGSVYCAIKRWRSRHG